MLELDRRRVSASGRARLGDGHVLNTEGWPVAMAPMRGVKGSIV